MSIISPLLDTLLHQVLGRRADMERIAARPVEQPLGAVTYTPAVRHATSDTPDEHLSDKTSDTQRRQPTTTETSLAARAGTAAATDADQGVSTRQHFSAEARTIAAVLARFPARHVAIRGSQPLVPEARMPTPGLLAWALGRELGLSGLFYEAHLSRWAQGRMDRQTLLEEPQGGLRPLMQSATPTDDGSGIDPHVDSSATVPVGQQSVMLVHDDSQALLRQQLELIATGIFRWRGEIWPGMPMEWEIEDEDSHLSPGPLRRWLTRIRLEMPMLGQIEFRLRLEGEQLYIHSVTETHDTRQQLSEQSAELQQRLGNAGFEVARPHFAVGTLR